MQFLKTLDDSIFKKNFPQELAAIFRDYYYCYIKTIMDSHGDVQKGEDILIKHLAFVTEQYKNPYKFPSYHPAERSPFDHLQFGLDFIEPLVIKEQSYVKNLFRVDEMIAQLSKGENVILFANHQVEPDPQAIMLMLKETHGEFAEKIIFVAGHRVTTDPFGIPFSMGCNLLCIYSKKYIETPPELKEEKLQYNQRTMNAMKELLAEGGKCIFVAPSGGRDRPNENGELIPAKFDARSIELFRLIAKQANTPTHFYPLALSTYWLMPPPPKVENALVESRTSKRAPIRICFGSEIFLDELPGLEGLDKHQSREKRAEEVWKIVNHDYQNLMH